MPLSTYQPERMGRAVIDPAGAFEAGAFQSFMLTYTAGYYGIDDTGSLKVVQRFASDMGKPQLDDPRAANYVTVEASNGAVLACHYHGKQNIRPWDKTLYIQVVRGFLREGDRITVRFGDPRRGSPGMRLQTFCEDTFEFKVLVDAFATYDYVELPDSPAIRIVSGAPVRWKAVLPTLRRVGEPFALHVKGEDRWGNPSDRCDVVLRLRPSVPVTGLPEVARFEPGRFSLDLGGLSVGHPGDLVVEVTDKSGRPLTFSNPLRVAETAPLGHYWGDLHSQSEETIGTNSARDMFLFARDRAFLDVASHQGNDFQVTTPFWRHLNDLTREFNEDGRFVVFPGYEWSGNTGLGGDRNVLFMEEGRAIHRSSHALVTDRGDVDSDAHSAEDLFNALKGEDCLVFAHIGGRYADIKMAHDVRLERSVEVHSDWGTFEWLLRDALEQGYRVGIVANSDGHKGRPGASHPGASLFGAYGGLTCILAPSLTRAGIMDAMRRRHHYATTGCRMILDVAVVFAGTAERFDDDPNLGPTHSQPVRSAMMGDIIGTSDDEVSFRVEALASAPIERIELRNGLSNLETWRPYGAADLGRRIRVIWEGSEYRGRGRQTIWDGSATLEGNAFQRLAPINHWNLDKRFEQTAPGRVEWTALTTGGFGGFDAWLDDPRAGTLAIDTALVKAELPLARIGLDDVVFEAGGIARRIRVFRLPDENPHRRVVLERRVALRKGADNPLYVSLTQEDGNIVWSSPVYVIG
jgi:hypothetical protein